MKENRIDPVGTDTAFIQDTKKQVIIDLENIEIIDPSIKSEFEILFFEDDTIILSSENYNEKQVDCTDILLYKYDLFSKETKFITKIENFYSSSGSMELVNGELYFPFSKLEGKTISNFIMNIDINSLDSEEVSYGKKPENAIRIESASNMILKHYQIDKGSDSTDYYVDVIKDGKNRNIIKSNYSSGNGELLIDIFGEKDKIYIYTLNIKDSNKTYIINQYDLNGNLEDKIELELDSFLDLPEVKDKDIVYNIYKINDYIILHTLNGRNRILKQEGRNFITIDIPKKLEDFNEGASIIEDSCKKDSVIYFEGLINRGEIIIFDTNNGKFSEILINSENILNIIRDSNGNLIVTTNEGDRAEKFYYINRSVFYN